MWIFWHKIRNWLKKNKFKINFVFSKIYRTFVKENKKAKGVFKELANELKTKEIPAWLNLNKSKLESQTVGEPNLDEVKPPAEISLIFEFYSR